MNLSLGVLLAWMYENPITTALVVVYLIANVAQRPHPQEMVGWKKTFWIIIDRLSFLSAAAVPGRLKLIFMASAPAPAATETKTETKENSGG